MRKFKKEETVYPTRDQNVFSVSIDASWTDDKVYEEVSKWLNQTRELFFDETTNYDIRTVNSCAPPAVDVEEFMKPAVVFGKENLEKLKELKRKYDPTCFFDKVA